MLRVVNERFKYSLIFCNLLLHLFTVVFCRTVGFQLQSSKRMQKERGGDESVDIFSFNFPFHKKSMLKTYPLRANDYSFFSESLISVL